jgi:hypothetical protein
MGATSEGAAMRQRAFDPYDPEYARRNQHARIVVFSTACILAALFVIGVCVPMLLGRL